MEHLIRTLTARLLASRSLPRTDPLVRRALVDEAFRVDLDARLANVGLQLIDNPYAAHVAVALADDMHEPVFGSTREYAASNIGLTRDQIALLVIIWALIVLPKRERQAARAANARAVRSPVGSTSRWRRSRWSRAARREVSCSPSAARTTCSARTPR